MYVWVYKYKYIYIYIHTYTYIEREGWITHIHAQASATLGCGKVTKFNRSLVDMSHDPRTSGGSKQSVLKSLPITLEPSWSRLGILLKPASFRKHKGWSGVADLCL